jgi:hypothetical protein
MTYIYYIDGERFTTDSEDIPWLKISSPHENTPAFENLLSGYRSWCKKGNIWHRLIGPARIFPDGSYTFCLNGKFYVNVKEWINNHPNPDLYFDNLGMNETDKVLWYLQN